MVVHACGATSSPCTIGRRHRRGRRGWCERHVRMRKTLLANDSKFDLCTYRAWRGLKLALQDPKVYIFALVCFTEILGLGFVNFFPTSVINFLVGSSYNVFTLSAAWLEQWVSQPLSHSYLHRMLPNFGTYSTIS